MNKLAHNLFRLASSGNPVPIKVAVGAFRIPTLDGCAPAFTEHITRACVDKHTDARLGTTITPNQNREMMAMLTTVETLAEADPALDILGEHNEEIILLLAQRVLVPALSAMGYIQATDAPQSKEQMARRHLESYFKSLGSETTHLAKNILRLALSDDTKEYGGLQQDWSKGCKLRCVAGAKVVKAGHPTFVAALLANAPVPAPYNSRDPLAIQFVRALVLHWVTPAIAHSLKALQVYGTMSSLHDVLLANSEAVPLLLIEEEHREGRDNQKRPRAPGVG